VTIGADACGHNYVWRCTVCHHTEEALTESDKDRMIARLNMTVEERNAEITQLQALLIERAFRAVTG
jgi:hypothetical protein